MATCVRRGDRDYWLARAAPRGTRWVARVVLGLAFASCVNHKSEPLGTSRGAPSVDAAAGKGTHYPGYCTSLHYQADGEFLNHHLLEYDSEGRQVREEWRIEGEPVSISIVTRRWAFDGLPLFDQRQEGASIGELETIYSYSLRYDAEGRLVEIVDELGEELPRTFTWSTSEDGRVRTEVEAQGGEVVSTSTRTSSEDGRVRTEVTVRADGIVITRVRRYDLQARLISQTFESEIHGPGVEKFVYDDAGDLVELSWCRDSDGAVFSRTTYASGGGRVVLRREYDDDDDGKLDAVRRHEYDELGNQTSEDYDKEGDGILDERTVYKRDTFGHLIEIEYQDGEGVIVQRALYRYDAAGNMLSDRRYDADGALIKYWEINYECWE